MAKSPKNTQVYLDANFLTAYLLASHTDAKKAQKFFAEILIAKTKMVFSPLTIDETLNAIVRTLKDQERINGILPSKSHKDYISDLKKAISIITKDQHFLIIQFTNSLTRGCQNAVSHIDAFNLRPRDAFHVSYMEDSKLNYIVSNDKNFDSVSSVTRLNF